MGLLEGKVGLVTGRRRRHRPGHVSHLCVRWGPGGRLSTIEWKPGGKRPAMVKEAGGESLFIEADVSDESDVESNGGRDRCPSTGRFTAPRTTPRQVRALPLFRRSSARNGNTRSMSPSQACGCV